MECPNCGLVNPESALRCDCGYDFKSNKMAKSYISNKDNKSNRFIKAIASLAFLGLIGIPFTLASINIEGWSVKYIFVLIIGISIIYFWKFIFYKSLKISNENTPKLLKGLLTLTIVYFLLNIFGILVVIIKPNHNALEYISVAIRALYLILIALTLFGYINNKNRYIRLCILITIVFATIITFDLIHTFIVIQKMKIDSYSLNLIIVYLIKMIDIVYSVAVGTLVHINRDNLKDIKI